jgi:hypothetical protein
MKCEAATVIAYFPRLCQVGLDAAVCVEAREAGKNEACQVLVRIVEVSEQGVYA